MVRETVTDLELARIGYWTDTFGCGVLFGMTLLVWVSAVWFMAVGLAIPAIGLGFFMMVLAACVVDKAEAAFHGRKRVRWLEGELYGQ